MLWLKQNTATTVTLGQAVSISDGYTPVTSGITPNQANIYVAGVPTALNNSVVHVSGGYYKVAIDAAEIANAGFIKIVVTDEDLILPLEVDAFVAPTTVFDSLAAGTDTLPTDVRQVLNSAVSSIDDFKADVSSIPTTTDATLTTATLQKIADMVWRRTISSIEASSTGDALSGRTTYRALARLVNKAALNDTTGNLEVYRSDDTTKDHDVAYTTTPGADPINSLDPT